MPATPAERPPRSPALPLADPVALADLRAQRGALAGTFAVFGTNGAVANEPPPRWLYDDDEVAQRLAGKPADDVLTAQVWRAAADVARGCAELLRPRSPFAAPPRRTVRDVRRRAATALRLLPAARLASLTPPHIEIDELDLHAWGPPTGAIEVAAVYLARAIDDDGWTDPEALAGWIADAASAVARYHAALATEDSSSAVADAAALPRRAADTTSRSMRHR
jgi:hypothetical protein